MKRILLVLLIVVATALSACSTGGEETAGSGDGCPEATEGTMLYTQESQGYCVLVPDTYQPFDSGDGNTTFVVGDLLNVSDPRLSITVTDAAGMSTEDAAARILVAFSLPEMGETLTATLDGEEAVVIDNLPGQDINRRVVVVHDGRMYDLMFSPIGPDYGEVGERTEELYQLVTESFTFLP